MGHTTVEEVLKLVEMVAEVPKTEQDDEHTEAAPTLQQDAPNQGKPDGGLSLEDIPDA